MESKLAQVQQLPPPSKPPILLEIEQARQEIQELRQDLAEIKRALGNLNILVKMSAAPRPEEIFKTIDPGLQKMEKKILTETQGMTQEALKRLTKCIDRLPSQIAKIIPQQKKGLFG